MCETLDSSGKTGGGILAVARTGKSEFYFPDGSYTTAVADRNALFLMGKYVMYKFVPHNAKLPKLKKK